MKLKNLLTESTNEPTFNKYFTVKGGHADFSDPLGVVVVGNLLNNSKEREWEKLESLPVNILKVSGQFALDGTGITNFKNFPLMVEGLTIFEAQKLTSLKGLEHCKIRESLVVDGSKITDLEGCPVGAKDYIFENNQSLMSTRGFSNDGGFTVLNLDNCPNLEDISNLLEPTPNPGKVMLEYSSNLPLVKLALINGLDGYHKFKVRFTGSNRGIEKIFHEFRGKGLGNTIKLTQKLRDQHVGGKNFKFS